MISHKFVFNCRDIFCDHMQRKLRLNVFVPITVHISHQYSRVLLRSHAKNKVVVISISYEKYDENIFVSDGRTDGQS